MSTLTVQDTWSTFQGTQNLVRCIVPADQQENKTPLSVTVCCNCDPTEQSDDARGIVRLPSRMTLQGYCYGIKFTSSINENSRPEVCVADLIDSNDFSVHDLIHKLARILVLKYHRPCYVQYSNSAPSSDSSAEQIDLLQRITHCIDNALAPAP